jgi:mannitol/fructose-specific phosphotransferase system IIA component (Ntr-type)
MAFASDRTRETNKLGGERSWLCSDNLPTPNISMTLAEFTNPGLIIPHLRGQDAASVIKELCQAMRREGHVPDLLPFYHTALNREFLVSTAMDAGMAFPHARLPGLKQLSFAFGRSDETLPWGRHGARAVRLVCLMAVPATEATQHLLLLSGLARLAKEDRLVQKLQAAQDTFQILEVLHQIKLRGGSMTKAPADRISR